MGSFPGTQIDPNDVSKRRTSARSCEYFTLLGSGFMTERNYYLVVSRHTQMEKISLAVVLRLSKTPLLKDPFFSFTLKRNAQDIIVTD